MKRLLALIFVLLMLGAPALAEPEEMAAVLAAELLPGYALIDGAQFDNTAMLLLKDAQGQEFFAGCVREGEEWTVTMSTPFPDWMGIELDTYHAGDGRMRLWTNHTPELREYEDELLDIYIELQPDGAWRVYGVNTGWEVIEFRRQSVYDDCGYEFFGDITIPLDITQIDWAMLPRSFHQAMALVDTSRWMICAVQYATVREEPAEGSAITLLCDAGTPVTVLAGKEDWVQVQLPGRSETGWTRVGNLLPGDYQIVRYDRWCEDGDDYGAREIILDSSDPAVTWYAAAHDESTAMPFTVDHVEYMTMLGWCTEGCCCLLYSETLDASGFVPLDQLPDTIE